MYVFMIICSDLSMWSIFAVSVLCMLLYRAVSSWKIWEITGSLKRVVLQFVDIEIFQVLMMAHKFELTGSSAPQRLIANLEASLEAAPQV